MSRAGDQTSVGTSTWDPAYDVSAATALPWVAGLLAGLAGVFAVSDALSLAGPDRIIAASVAAGLAVLLAALAVGSRRRPVPHRLAQPVTAASLVAVAVHPVVVMGLTGEPQESMALLVIAAAAGSALLSVRWLVGTLYLVWGGWTAAALLAGPSRDWLPYAGGLALATGLALASSHVRRLSCRELAVVSAALEAAAVRDQLTGLANRRGLAMIGAQIVEQARRQGDAAHCIFVDVAGLRAVNETAGQAAGDTVVVAVAEALREVTRATDVVARWGGDEFCVVGPGPGMAPLELERRARETVALNPPVSAELWPVRLSAGGSMLAPWDAGTLDTLLGSADKEMHLRRSLRRETYRPRPHTASAD